MTKSKNPTIAILLIVHLIIRIKWIWFIVLIVKFVAWWSFFRQMFNTLDRDQYHVSSCLDKSSASLGILWYWKCLAFENAFQSYQRKISQRLKMNNLILYYHVNKEKSRWLLLNNIRCTSIFKNTWVLVNEMEIVPIIGNIWFSLPNYPCESLKIHWLWPVTNKLWTLVELFISNYSPILHVTLKDLDEDSESYTNTIIVSSQF